MWKGSEEGSIESDGARQEGEGRSRETVKQIDRKIEKVRQGDQDMMKATGHSRGLLLRIKRKGKKLICLYNQVSPH